MDVAALLAHPLATFGLSREQVAKLAPLVEIAVLRVVADGSPSWAARADGARGLAEEPHAFHESPVPLASYGRLLTAGWIRLVYSNPQVAIFKLLPPLQSEPS